MSSDLYTFDNFFTDSFSPFCDPSVDILEANNYNPVDESASIDQFAHSLLSSSPPSNLLGNLSICQTNSNHLQTLAPNGYQDFSCLDSMEVKSEDSLVGFDSSSSYNQIQQEPLVLPHSYSGVENVAKYMQRSYSSNCFDGKPGFSFQPRFDSVLESPNFHNQALSSPENSFFAGQMRRVCSTGDLQYACRKTLADNRPRIRGRFARNDEAGDVPKAAYSARDEDEDELWLDGLQQEEEEDGANRGGGGGPFVSSFGQYYGYY
ncbi:CCT domain-containing protein [Citrus sinensis]|nr:CCT domain-containing protein [Citrus sinensis]